MHGIPENIVAWSVSTKSFLNFGADFTDDTMGPLNAMTNTHDCMGASLTNDLWAVNYLGMYYGTTQTDDIQGNLTINTMNPFVTTVTADNWSALSA